MIPAHWTDSDGTNVEVLDDFDTETGRYEVQVVTEEGERLACAGLTSEQARQMAAALYFYAGSIDKKNEGRGDAPRS